MDLERNFEEKEELDPIAQCECCGSEIMPWEDYYDIDGTFIHDECGLDYLKQFRKYA